MQGALTARAVQEAQAEQTANTSDAVSGVPVGRPQPSGRPGAVSGVAVTSRPRKHGDVQVVESTAANLVGHNSLAGLIEYTQVSSAE